MSMKQCRRCGEVKPATLEYFHREKRNADGLYSYCKVCKKNYEAQNAERISQRRLKKRLSDVEGYRERGRRWYHENKDKRQEYIERNRDKIEQYQIVNKEKIRQRDHFYKKKHKERIAEYREWYRKTYREVINSRRSTPEGLEKSRKYCQKRRALKRSLEATFSTAQWAACTAHFEGRCCYCGKFRKLEQDHFIPISKGGEYSINNIVPACVGCNRSKADNDFSEWYSSKKFYSKQREKEILLYLGYKKEDIQQLTLTI